MGAIDKAARRVKMNCFGWSFSFPNSLRVRAVGTGFELARRIADRKKKSPQPSIRVPKLKNFLGLADASFETDGFWRLDTLARRTSWQTAPS